MAKPMPTPPPADAEVGGASPLDEVEASAWVDIKAALTEGGDDAAGQQALKDFVVACVKRQLAQEYKAPAKE
jgi:hypothetical protein